jgi:exodeoxyribonuclease I
MFVFYDIESTGTSTAFDQILQFGAILTDGTLQEVDRIEARCRLLPHIVPSPGAMRITGLWPANLTDPALPGHAEAVARVAERLLDWSPATFLGWNSLRFDESLLRQSLFTTLQPPFLTTSHGNGRGDVMRMVQVTDLHVPGAIDVPVDDRGRRSFRLDRLAPANGCGAGNAHDAIADVEATLGLARLVRDRAPAVWQRLCALTRPETVRTALRDADSLVHTDFVFNRAHNRLITYCGTNPDYDGEIAAFDLAFKPEDVLDLSVDDLIAVLARRPRTIVSIRATRQPLLMPAEAAPANTGALRFSPDRLRERASRIRAAEGFQQRVGEALARRPRTRAPDRPVETRLYDRPIASGDAERLQAFHAAPWRERPALVAGFADERLRELGRRLVWLERPDIVAPEERLAWDQWCAERLLSEDPDVPWRTVAAALREAENAMVDATQPHRAFFEEVRAFLDGIADRWATRL